MCKCQYPECNLESARTWGLVPLCSVHHELIKQETDSYYQNPKSFFYENRKHYIEIIEKIPWSQAN